MAAKSPSTIACPVCGNINQYDQEACLKCGTPLEPIRSALQSIKAGRDKSRVEPARPRSEPSRPATEKKTSSSTRGPARAWWPWAVGAAVFVILAVVGIQLDWFTPSAATPAPAPTLSPGSIQASPADGMQQVFIPAGTFQMGLNADTALAECRKYTNECNPEIFLSAEPVHGVSMSSFWIDRTEVTNAMFVAFLNAPENRSVDPAAWFDSQSVEDHIHQADGAWLVDPGYADHPAIAFRDGAASYCAWAGRRLPTEAEWEYAARGSDGRLYPWGNQAPTCAVANYSPSTGDRCVGETTAVGSYPAGASPFGVLDMAGNLREWVSDWQGDYPQIDPREAIMDPQGPASGLNGIARGGAWSRKEWSMMATLRYFVGSGTNTGFRCAHSATGEEAIYAQPTLQTEAAVEATPPAIAQGRIAFVSSTDIWVINPDGSGLQNLTNTPGTLWEGKPRWSPDGTRIIFEEIMQHDIGIINADGSGLVWEIHDYFHGTDPTWAPDGGHYAFVMDLRDGNYLEENNLATGQFFPAYVTGSYLGTPAYSPDGQRLAFNQAFDIHVLTIDEGTPGRFRTPVRLTYNGFLNSNPSWSPDGQRLVFHGSPSLSENLEIYVINADGTGLTNLTNDPAYDQNPSWSPDGSQIVFASTRGGDGKQLRPYIMNADGSGVRLLIDMYATETSWQPAP